MYHTPLSHASESKTAEAVGPITYTVDEIVARIRGGRLFVTLPPAESESECPKIFHDVQRLSEIVPGDIDWLVDLSRMHKMPLPLIQLFASMSDDFKEQGRNIMLVGARPGVLPPSDFALHPFAAEDGPHR